MRLNLLLITYAWKERYSQPKHRLAEHISYRHCSHNERELSKVTWALMAYSSCITAGSLLAFPQIIALTSHGHMVHNLKRRNRNLRTIVQDICFDTKSYDALKTWHAVVLLVEFNTLVQKLLSFYYTKASRNLHISWKLENHNVRNLWLPRNRYDQCFVCRIPVFIKLLIEFQSSN